MTARLFSAFIGIVMAASVAFAQGPELPRIVQLEEPAAELRFEHVQLFDAEVGRILSDHTVIIQGDRITWVGASDDPAIPAADPAATTVDGRGKTLLPGLIDAHVHIGGDGAPFWHAGVPSLQRNLDAALYAGVTGVFNLGGPIEGSAGLREALRFGALDGPDLYIAIGGFTAVGGYSMDIIEALLPEPMREPFVADSYFQADTVSELEGHMERFAAAAPDVMKILIDSVSVDAPVISDEVLRQAAAEGRALGVPVVAHVSTPAEAMRAVDGGVTGLAHTPDSGEFSDEQVSRVAGSGVCAMSTLVVVDRLLMLVEPDPVSGLTEMARAVLDPAVVQTLGQRPAGYELPELWVSWLDAWSSGGGDAGRNLLRLYEAGVSIVVATDAGSGPGWGQGHSMHEELAAVVAAGIPITAALQGATIHAARCMLIDQEVGSIAVGKQADLLLLSADPTVDIGNTTMIEAVYSNGRLVNRLP